MHELEQNVRALLRDVVCGYLSGDLRSVADDILLATGAPIEISARDTRDEPDDTGTHPLDELDLLSEPPPRAEEREDGLPEPLATGEYWEPEPPDHRVVRRERPTDGPGTAADPRSAAWRIASEPGPRTKRERTKREQPQPVGVAAEADEPTSRMTAEADEPTSRIAALDPPEPDLTTDHTPSADWDDDDCWSAPV